MIGTKVKGYVQYLLRRSGYRLVRYPLKRFLDQNGVDMVFDVGANDGGFARELRNLDYSHRIISFEPMKAAFDRLERQAANQPNWTTLNIGLAAAQREATLNLAGASSSMLDMMDRHREAAPHVKSTGTETVQLKTLDEVFGEYCQPQNSSFLKLDTQGYELEILQGAGKCLSEFSGVQLEISLSPLYENGPLIEDIFAYMRAQSFEPFWFDQAFFDPHSHQLLQADAIFVNSRMKKN